MEKTLVSRENFDREIGALKSDLTEIQELYLTFKVDIKNTSTYSYDIKPKKGEVYKIVNGSTSSVAIWTTNSAKQTVQEFPAMAIGATKEITISADAEYLNFYSGGTGTVSVENISKKFPVLSDTVSVHDSEIDKFNGFVYHDERTNLIDKSKLSDGYINGAVDGAVVNSSAFKATDYIPVEEAKQYYMNYVYTGYCAFYDETKRYISGVGARTATYYLKVPFVVPANAKYARFTILSANVEYAWICETNQMTERPSNYDISIHPSKVYKPTDYDGDDICVFKKILCIGDSLTDGFFNENGGSNLIMRERAYPAQLQKITGIECTNMGYAGYTSVEWWNAYKDDDFSGYDCCIVQLGANDALRSVSVSDTTTAFTNIINKIKMQNKNIIIFVATIIPANGYMVPSMATMSDRIRTIVSTINDENVILIDLWKYGKTDDTLAYDCGHLSAYGYYQLAKDYKAYISYIIKNNPMLFRFVQFIGTDYSFNAEEEARTIAY